MNAYRNSKPFLTYEQLVDKLINDKKLIIMDKEQAIKLLKKHSYFAFISGYKVLFKKANSGEYKDNTHIEDIFCLYTFDDKLRAVIFNNILIFEKHIKSVMAYAFCEEFGEEQNHYLDATKYDYTIDKQSKVNELILRLTNLTNAPYQYQYIKHQADKYNNIPLWVLLKALPIGSVSIMYSVFKQKIQTKICKEFVYIRENDLMRMLDILSRVRNVCAHNERLFDYKYHKGSILDNDIHYNLGIKQRNNQFNKGKSDLFAVLISLKYLLEHDDFSKMIDNINELIEELCRSTVKIQKLQILKHMGFPENWTDIKVVQKTKP